MALPANSEEERLPKTDSLASTLPTPISQTAGIKRKLSQGPEAEADRPVKQSRRTCDLSPLGGNFPNDPKTEAKADDLEPPPLSEEFEEDLRKIYKTVMDTTTSIRPGSIKRTSSRSRRSVLVPSEAESIRSQRSANTTAHYRYNCLEDANVYIHVEPPEDVRVAIAEIVDAEHSEDRHTLVRGKAEKFWKKCKEMVRAAAGEDDFVHIFYTIAEEISPDNLIFREKADWRVEIKPTIQQSDANLSFLSDFNVLDTDDQQEADNASAPPPPKRHQQSAGHLYISPQTSQTYPSDSPSDNNMQPSQDKTKETSPVKTPRPDITVGIKESALISDLAATLSSQKFNLTKTKQFLKKLQGTTILSEPDGRQELALVIVPTQRESNLAFPSLILEGKGYSTNKQIFEAQNQASISGACGVKMQIMLDELVKRAARSSLFKNKPPLVFSICTEGPYHELWAHYTVVEDGERRFNMVLLDACNGVLLKQVEEFFLKVDNVMIWTAGSFLGTVVERLAEVARRAER